MDLRSRGAPNPGTPNPWDRRFVVILGTVFLVGVLALATAARAEPPPESAAAALPQRAPLTQSATGIPPSPTTVVSPTNQGGGSNTTPATNFAGGTPLAMAATAIPTTPATAAPLTAPPATSAPSATATAAPVPTATAAPLVADTHTGSPVPTATLTEAETPLHLAAPLNSTTAQATVPWWQTAFDIAWKLAIVIGLILLAMRALAALKGRGFAWPRARPATKIGVRFFEKIEEIRLSPQHVLIAVRAGDRILLLAQTATTLRQVGEILAEVEDEESIATGESALAMVPATQARFDQQVLRAWRGLLPATPPDTEEAPMPETPPQPDKAVVDASWVTVEPDAHPVTPPAPPTTATPRRGTARPAEKPAPVPVDTLDAGREREILWFAEEHGASAAAEKFGMTRQRVTALQRRYERDRVQRRTRSENAPAMPAQDASPPSVAPAKPAPTSLEANDPPTRTTATPRRAAASPPKPPDAQASLTTARASLARSAYSAKPPPPPDVADLPNDLTTQAAQVARDLAVRLGLAVKTKRT